MSKEIVNIVRAEQLQDLGFRTFAWLRPRRHTFPVTDLGTEPRDTCKTCW